MTTPQQYLVMIILTICDLTDTKSLSQRSTRHIGTHHPAPSYPRHPPNETTFPYVPSELPNTPKTEQTNPFTPFPKNQTHLSPSFLSLTEPYMDTSFPSFPSPTPRGKDKPNSSFPKISNRREFKISPPLKSSFKSHPLPSSPSLKIPSQKCNLTYPVDSSSFLKSNQEKFKVSPPSRSLKSSDLNQKHPSPSLPSLKQQTQNENLVSISPKSDQEEFKVFPPPRSLKPRDLNQRHSFPSPKLPIQKDRLPSPSPKLNQYEFRISPPFKSVQSQNPNHKHPFPSSPSSFKNPNNWNRRRNGNGNGNERPKHELESSSPLGNSENSKSDYNSSFLSNSSTYNEHENSEKSIYEHNQSSATSENANKTQTLIIPYSYSTFKNTQMNLGQKTTEPNLRNSPSSTSSKAPYGTNKTHHRSTLTKTTNSTSVPHTDYYHHSAIANPVMKTEARNDDEDNNSTYVDEATRPYLAERNSFVRVYLGDSAQLDCLVNNAANESVSWLRRDNDLLELLTWEDNIYTNDNRFSVVEEDGDGWRRWTLKIHNVGEKDEGGYRCQVATYPPLLLDATLVVEVPVARVVDERGNKVEEKHYNGGSMIELKCVIQHVPFPHGPVTWLRDNTVLTFNTSRGGISVRGERDWGYVRSRLYVARAKPTDSGPYSCCYNDTTTCDSVMVHVIAGENPAAMQHDAIPTNRSTHHHHLHLYLTCLINYLIWTNT